MEKMYIKAECCTCRYSEYRCWVRSLPYLYCVKRDKRCEAYTYCEDYKAGELMETFCEKGLRGSGHIHDVMLQILYGRKKRWKREEQAGFKNVHINNYEFVNRPNAKKKELFRV